MLLCVDVHYEEHGAVTACVGFSGWADAESTLELVVRSDVAPEPYVPGEFYKRELPHLHAAVERVSRRYEVETIVIDGNVWLSPDVPGLGVHLHQALGGRVPIIGVAKTKFREGAAISVLRGESRQPLFVTAIGVDATSAAERIRGMHGQHRLPALLKRVDHLARGHDMPSLAKAIDALVADERSS